MHVSLSGLYPATHVIKCVLQDNILHGRFLAELTQEVLTDLELSKYQHAEYRISIYGRKQVEWDILAAWYCQNKLYSDNVLWLIQVSHMPVLLTVTSYSSSDVSNSAHKLCAAT